MVLHNMCIDHGLLTELETSMDGPTPDIDYLQEPSENGILMRETIVTEFSSKLCFIIACQIYVANYFRQFYPD